jgi:hypothetical protein
MGKSLLFQFLLPARRLENNNSQRPNCTISENKLKSITSVCVLISLIVPLFTIAASQSSWTKKSIDGKTIITKTNDDGARISFFRVAGNALTMDFNGSTPFILDPTVCPTIQVDSQPALFFAGTNKLCDVSEHRARYTITTSSSTLASTLLHALMNGEEIVFRFVVFSGLYGKTAFSLKGSKQVLQSIN